MWQGITQPATNASGPFNQKIKIVYPRSPRSEGDLTLEGKNFFPSTPNGKAFANGEIMAEALALPQPFQNPLPLTLEASVSSRAVVGAASTLVQVWDTGVEIRWLIQPRRQVGATEY